MMTRHPIPGMLPDSQADRSDHAFANISTTDSTQNKKSGAGLAPAQEILLLAMKAGQIQLENGAEIFRVEDTIMHICRAYGLHSVHIFVLSNGIFLSCGDETEPLFAKVLQVPVNNTNLRRVAEVNQLSRRIEEEGLSPENVRRELTRIEEHPGFPAALASCSAARRGIFYVPLLSEACIRPTPCISAIRIWDESCAPFSAVPGSPFFASSVTASAPEKILMP